MNKLSDRVKHLEAEKLNWESFQNYFESQLSRFFLIQSIEQSPESRGQPKIYNQTEQQKTSLKNSCISNQNTNFSKNDSVSQNPDSELKKKKQIIEKQREYIKLIDQELWVFKQNILLQKDQEIERQIQENKIIQNQYELVTQEVVNYQNKINQLQQQNSILQYVENTHSQQIIDIENDSRQSKKQMKKQMEDQQNFIEQIQNQFNFHGEQDLINLLQNIDKKQESDKLIQVDNRQSKIKIEDYESLQEQFTQEKLILRNKYHQLTLELQYRKDENSVLSDNKKDYLTQIGNLNKKIKLLTDSSDQVQEQNMSHDQNIRQFQRQIHEFNIIFDESKLEVELLQQEIQDLKNSAVKQQRKETDYTLLLEDRDKENQNLQDQKQSNITQIEFLNQKVKHITDSSEQIQESNIAQDQNIRQLQRQIQELNLIMEQKQSEFSSFNISQDQNVRKIQRQIQEQNIIIEQQKHEVENLNTNLINEKQKNDSAIDRLSRHNESLHQENKDLKDISIKQQKKENDYTIQLQDHSNENQSLQDNKKYNLTLIVNLNQKVKQLTDSSEQIQELNISKDQNIRQFQRQVQELNMIIDQQSQEIKSQNTNLSSEKQKNYLSADKLQRINDTLIQDIQDLKDSAVKQLKKESNYILQLQDREDENQSLQNQKKSNITSIEYLNQKVKHLTDLSEQIQESNISQDQNIRQLQLQVHELNTIQDQQLQQIEHLKTILSSEKQKINLSTDRLSQHINLLNQEIKDLKGSAVQQLKRENDFIIQEQDHCNENRGLYELKKSNLTMIENLNQKINLLTDSSEQIQELSIFKDQNIRQLQRQVQELNIIQDQQLQQIENLNTKLSNEKQQNYLATDRLSQHNDSLIKEIKDLKDSTMNLLKKENDYVLQLQDCSYENSVLQDHKQSNLTQIVNLNQKIKQLTDSFEQIQVLNDSKDQNTRQLQGHIQELNTTIDEQRQEVENHLRDRKLNNLATDRLSQHNDSLIKEIKDLKDSTMNLLKKENDYVLQLQDCSNENSFLQDHKKSNLTQIVNLNQKIKQLTDSFEQIQVLNDSKDQNTRQLQGHIQELNTTIDEQRQEVENHLRDRKLNNLATDKLSQHFDSLHQEINDLKDSELIYKKMVTDYNLQLQNLNQEHQSLLENQNDHFTLMENLNKKIKVLTDQFEQINELNMSQDQNNRQLQIQIQELKLTLDQQKIEVDNLQTHLSNEKQTNNSVSNQLTKNNDKLYHEINELKISALKHFKIESDFQTLKQNNVVIVLQKEKLEQECELLQLEIQQIRKHDKFQEEHEFRNIELDQSININLKKMSHMKQKLESQTKNLEAFSKKVGIVLQNKLPHGEDHKIDEFQNLICEISTLIDSMSNIQIQIQVDQEKKLLKEMEKQKGLVQQNILLKIQIKQLETFQIQNLSLQKQIDELQKDLNKLNIDNKNLSVIARHESHKFTSQFLVPSIREHRKSMQENSPLTEAIQISPQPFKLQIELDKMKKDLIEAQKIIHQFQTNTISTPDMQINFLHKRVVDLQNQLKNKQLELDNSHKELDKQKLQYDKEIDRLEDDVDERDERLQDLMKDQLQSKEGDPEVINQKPLIDDQL